MKKVSTEIHFSCHEQYKHEAYGDFQESNSREKHNAYACGGVQLC